MSRAGSFLRHYKRTFGDTPIGWGNAQQRARHLRDLRRLEKRGGAISSFIRFDKDPTPDYNRRLI